METTSHIIGKNENIYVKIGSNTTVSILLRNVMIVVLIREIRKDMKIKEIQIGRTKK